MRVKLFIATVTAAATSVMIAAVSYAATPNPQGNFSLQVTPSPLVATLKPGVPTELELKIRNGSTASEELKIEAKRFKLNDTTGEITFDSSTPPEIVDWLSFSAPTFTVQPGEWYTQKVKLALPRESGFSYAFALQISRANLPTTNTGGRLINGSVAVFTLLNVDRPGATRKVELVSFKPSQGLYEYLPAKFDLRLKNTGNTIVQPYGNIYIQRGAGDEQALATLPVNDVRAYLLPGSERTLSATWNDGFPVAKTTTDSSGKQSSALDWNFDRASRFRIGSYTARAVAVYNDGTRDVPVNGELSFWVLPWKAILLILLVLGAAFFLLRRYIKLRTEKAVKKALASQKKE